MRRELLKYASVEVPRYTSYPTAAQFHAGIGEREYRNWLAQVSEGESVSFYVHVPFCRQLCWYCGCHTTVVHDYSRIARYLVLLNAEIDALAAALPARIRVSRVHFGGGTPTILDMPDFRNLVDRLRSLFPFADGAEIAVESDPRGMTREYARNLAAAGVTRISLGVQDFSPHIQTRINRRQPFAVVAQAVECLRNAGVASINLDLMYGLPAQTVADVEHTAELALQLEPQRVAVFGYAHVPWFKKHQRMLRASELPGVESRSAQAEAAARILKSGGLVEVGFDHFAHPDDGLACAARTGRLRRNFQGYSDDTAETLLGLGASSISSLRQGYAQNAAGLDDYRDRLSLGQLPIKRGIGLSEEDRVRRAVIERLMCDFAVDVAALCRSHGSPEGALDADLAALAPLAADGLVTVHGRHVAVRDEARRLVRSVAACFDAYLRSHTGARHSLAV